MPPHPRMAKVSRGWPARRGVMPWGSLRPSSSPSSPDLPASSSSYLCPRTFSRRPPPSSSVAASSVLLFSRALLLLSRATVRPIACMLRKPVLLPPRITSTSEYVPLTYMFVLQSMHGYYRTTCLPQYPLFGYLPPLSGLGHCYLVDVTVVLASVDEFIKLTFLHRNLNLISKITLLCRLSSMVKIGIK